MSLTALAGKLQDLGHPLGTTAIHKIEQGERKPDVDDLVAFALALGAAPNVLLLPPRGTEVPLTSAVAMPFAEAWRWARDGVPATVDGADSWTLGEWMAWEDAHPDQPGDVTLRFSPEVRERMETVTRMAHKALEPHVEAIRGKDDPAR